MNNYAQSVKFSICQKFVNLNVTNEKQKVNLIFSFGGF